MVKHLELAKFIQKFVFLSFFKLFGQISAIMDFKIQKFGRNIFHKTPPNWTYSIMNKIIVLNQIISSSLEHM